MKIAIACDHGGFILKESVAEAVKESGCEVLDLGTFSEQSVDYPDYACLVANAVLKNEADAGILLCGTGIGISIAANKFKGIRCALLNSEFAAQMAKEHNNANVIALGGRVTASGEAKKIVKAYLSATFAGGRHQDRLNKITKLES
jgi:ribose 5-phosphate isomerase B